jgi:hypothetical protein
MRATVASTRRVKRRCAAVALALGVGSSSAHAGPTEAVTNGNEARAEARFREGSQAFDEGRVDEACAAFDESLHLLLTLGTLLNLALCHERQGKTATAWREFTHAAALASDNVRRDRREFAHQHALRLERVLSPLRIEVPRDAAVDVTIDGESVFDVRQPLPVFLDPGPHRIVASAPGRKRFEVTVTVPVGGSSDALVVSVPRLEEESIERPTAPSRAESAAPGPNPRRTAGFLLGGVGVASLGVGVYFGANSLSKMGALASSCPSNCDPGEARTSETVSMVAFGAGAVAVAAGAWLVLTARAPVTRDPVLAQVVPQLGVHSGGVSIVGAW